MSGSESIERFAAAADTLIGAGPSHRFVGEEHGADISFFYVENHPGEGPGLHWHPYSETWMVLEGRARVTRGDEVIDAKAGDTATVPPRVPHAFTNTGDGVLRIMCIHVSPVMIQTFLDEE